MSTCYVTQQKSKRSRTWRCFETEDCEFYESSNPSDSDRSLNAPCSKMLFITRSYLFLYFRGLIKNALRLWGVTDIRIIAEISDPQLWLCGRAGIQLPPSGLRGDFTFQSCPPLLSPNKWVIFSAEIDYRDSQQRTSISEVRWSRLKSARLSIVSTGMMSGFRWRPTDKRITTIRCQGSQLYSSKVLE